MKKILKNTRKKKFLFLLLLVWLFSGHLPLMAQETGVSFSLQRASMKEIMEEIKKQTGYDVVYSEVLFANIQPKDVNYRNVKLEELLSDCLKGTGVTYSINGQTIILKKEGAKTSFRMLKGIVTGNDGEPLPGVTVLIKGSSLATSTNKNGYYQINVPMEENVVLIFTFIGKKGQQIKVGNKEQVDVVLEDEASEMEEVVVTGYQQIDKRHLTSAVTSLRASDILVPGMSSIDLALEGQVPELVLMLNSGEVGTTPRIRVRGTSTLMGNREPLWVLDGFIMYDPVDVSTEDLNDPDYINIIGNAIAGINPQDIERIDILKDASATALYGTRAANGVIVVTTKKGAVGPTRFSYNHTSKLTRRPRYTDRNINLMNSRERVQFGKELSDLHYQFPSGMTMVGYEGALHRYYSGLISYQEFVDEVAWFETVNTDWFKILTQDSYSHDHTLGISGGTQNARYYFSVGYSREEGVSRTTYTERYTARSNLDLSLSEKFKLNISVSGNIQKKNHLISNIDAMDYAYNTTRALPCYNEDGTLYFYEKSGYDGANRDYNKFRYNILNEIDNSSNGYDGNTISLMANLRYNIIKGLEISASGSYSRSSTLQEQWWGEKSHYVARWKNGEYESVPLAGENGYCFIPYGGILRTTNSINENTSLRFQGEYRKSFGVEMQHMANIMGGFEMNSNTSQSINDENRGFVKERGLQFVDGIDLNKYPHYADWINTNHRKLSHNISRQVSGYFTLSYSYKNYFTLNTNGRFDASNKFGSRSNERLLPVWSVSGMWNARETFFRNTSFFNEVRIRASLGIQGNMLDDQSPNLIIKQGTIDPFYNENVSTIARYPNPNLRWEETLQFSSGIDMTFLDSRLTLQGSFYYKKTENCFTHVKVSSVNGVSQHTYVMNGGDLKNSGYSISLSAIPVKRNDFQWRFSTYYSGNFNQVQTEAVESYQLGHYLNGLALVNGQAISSFYSYKFMGLNPEDGSPIMDDYSDRQHLLKNKTLEEIVMMTMEKSGQRDPKFTGSLNNSINYKNFGMTVNFSYSLGSKVRLFALYSPIKSGVSSEANVRKEFLSRWKTPGDEEWTNIPAIISPEDPNYARYNSHFSASPSVATSILNFASNAWDMYDKSNIRVVSGNYLKCTSLSLRYSVPTKVLAQMPFSSLSMSFNTMNLFTISAKELKGQDPSQAGFDKPNLSIRPSYTFQFNVTF